jgi:hypothetical protein
MHAEATQKLIDRILVIPVPIVNHGAIVVAKPI